MMTGSYFCFSILCVFKRMFIKSRKKRTWTKWKFCKSVQLSQFQCCLVNLMSPHLHLVSLTTGLLLNYFFHHILFLQQLWKYPSLSAEVAISCILDYFPSQLMIYFTYFTLPPSSSVYGVYGLLFVTEKSWQPFCTTVSSECYYSTDLLSLWTLPCTLILSLDCPFACVCLT